MCGAQTIPVGLLLLAATVAVSIPVTAQAPDPWLGTWKLNLEKSKYDPANLTPKSQTVKQEAIAGGGMKATVDGVDSQGKPVHYVVTTMFDGKSSEVKGRRMRTRPACTSASTAGPTSMCNRSAGR